MKKKNLVHSRAKAPGNIYVYVGGKTGRDGIHGVNFASEELTEESEEKSRSAVQVGDPITKEPLIHVTLECVEKGLLEGLKDFGGGGLSCVCGEMAHDTGFGAEISLDDIPLKEPGMAPWEIWVSESQERMMFLVDRRNLDEVLEICKKWDVFAVPIGKVIKERVTRVFYKNEKVLELDTVFQTGGPVYDEKERPYQYRKKHNERDPEFDVPDIEIIFKKLLSSYNIASKEWVIRQYDHEVRGNTVIKPLQGLLGKESHGDAAVIKPLESSFKGIAITADVNPRFTEIDPYWGAMSAMDEACRNLVAVGAKPDSIADCLNFGNPEKPSIMGEFYESCRGLGEIARALKLPFISGNVSFYNESVGKAIPPTPEIMGIGIVPDIRKCVTIDLKKEGNPLYVIGETKQELGGSAYYEIMNLDGGAVPKVNIDSLKRSIDAILNSIWNGYIKACHDVSAGGLAVTLAEMMIAGDIGAEIDITNVGRGLRSDFKVFSESNTRWIVEVRKEKMDKFEEYLNKNNITSVKIGTVGGKSLTIKDSNKKLIDVDVTTLDTLWRKPIWDIMG